MEGPRGPVTFLTMKLLRGESLSERLKRAGAFDLESAWPIVRQMADALDAAHRAGVDSGRALYECDGVTCTDPEIEVGSSVGMMGVKGVVAARNPPTAIGYLYCEGDNAVIRPPTVTFRQSAVSAGVSILWRSLGAGPPDWTVDNLSNPICQESSPFNKGNPTCSLKTDATAPSTTYRATVTGCRNPATGTITITP